MADAVPPPGHPAKVWIIIRPSGERYYVDREPEEGIASWARGLDATITEYVFAAVRHTPPQRSKGAPARAARER